MSRMNDAGPAWIDAHQEALRKGRLSYVDPETGYQVFSELALRKRGKCCGAGCRHCPYEHIAVPGNPKVRPPSYLSKRRPQKKPLSVLFWSGGKDSFLALCSLINNPSVPLESLVLLTTYDPFVDLIAHQEVKIGEVVAQAETLELPLLGVPLQPGEEYTERIGEALHLLTKPGDSIRSLAFGDLHLQHVLDWRTKNLAPLAATCGASLQYPVLDTPYTELLDLFEKSEAKATVSATTVREVSVGENFTRQFTQSLPSSVDQFGERGEFHTLIEPRGSVAALRTRLLG